MLSPCVPLSMTHNKQNVVITIASGYVLFKRRRGGFSKQISRDFSFNLVSMNLLNNRQELVVNEDNHSDWFGTHKQASVKDI